MLHIYQHHRFALLGLITALAYWLLESVLHAWFWDQGTLTQTLLASHDSNELIMRFIIVMLMVIMGMLTDSQQRRLQNALKQQQRSNQLLRFLSHINQHVQRQTAINSLLDSACLAAVEYGHFPLALIAMQHNGELQLQALHSAHESIEAQYQAINDAVKHCAMHQSVLSTKERRNFLLREDCQLPFCKVFPGHRIAIIPLYSRNTIDGTMSIISQSPQGFSEQEISLLEEACDDISVLLRHFNLEEVRRQNLLALHASEQRFALLLDAVAEGIIGINEQGNCSFVNTAAITLLGLSNKQQALKKPVHDLLHPQHYHCQEKTCSLQSALQQSNIWHSEAITLWSINKSNKIAIECWLHPAEHNDDATNKEAHTIAVLSFINIHERKSRESEMHKYTTMLERFQQATIEREWRIKKLREKNHQLEEAIALLQHRND